MPASVAMHSCRSRWVVTTRARLGRASNVAMHLPLQSPISSTSSPVNQRENAPHRAARLLSPLFLLFEVTEQDLQPIQRRLRIGS